MVKMDLCGAIMSIDYYGKITLQPPIGPTVSWDIDDPRMLGTKFREECLEALAAGEWPINHPRAIG